MSHPPPEVAAPPPARGLRGIIVRGVNRLTGARTSSIDYSAPPGDPGLFGPDAVCWKVHADFTSMMAGGVSALLLQALHPLALAGVWDHSTFRQDIHGRLGRTATFIAATTFGSRADALRLIEQVRTIHRRVQGVAPDGRPYAADDPALLRWVHVAEVSSFLAAYLRYVDPHLPQAARDRYFAETAQIAEALGATDVPKCESDITAYLASMRPELVASERSHAVVRILLDAAPRYSLAWPIGKLLLNGGIDLLPDWAQQMLGLDRWMHVKRAIVRPGVRRIGALMRWALRNGVSRRARARVAAGAWSGAPTALKPTTVPIDASTPATTAASRQAPDQASR
ncbi:MAG: oxygenase MpaB family protein [Janthinobacterium lividum]